MATRQRWGAAVALAVSACALPPSPEPGVDAGRLTSVSHCDGAARVTEYREGSGRVFATSIVWDDAGCRMDTPSNAPAGPP